MPYAHYHMHKLFLPFTYEVVIEWGGNKLLRHCHMIRHLSGQLKEDRLPPLLGRCAQWEGRVHGRLQNKGKEEMLKEAVQAESEMAVNSPDWVTEQENMILFIFPSTHRASLSFH